MRIGEYETHPAADVFPLIEGQELEDLAADIFELGQREPIVRTSDGLILDGRNRLRACLARGLSPRFTEFGGTDPVAFVISVNLRRRHLNESQRAMVAARVATLPRGKPIASIEAITQGSAASKLNVGRATVQRAREVLERATPEVIAAVDRGEMAVSLAAKVAQRPQDEQREIAARVSAGELPIEATRHVTAARIEQRRIEKPTGKYRVIYADPPWSYGNSMPPGTTTPNDYYPTMTTEEICALPIRELAEDNAVLFLWTTSPHLEESFSVIRAWGFEYKSSFVWDKVAHNMGHYNSVRHEFVLVCVRGSCQPDVRKLFDSVVTEERTEHSRKPDVFYQIIDTIYPRGARVELFARRPREGWAAWGYEAEARSA